ncbi:MAG: bifunctional folylpolyglutamate synthase/dihydrofolate synthase [Bacteroidales bacterium]|jgi:dihydrofolate synthase/folylpolyglutamate synthase|nr:bifunctional folylpolyglutamate synthase/dihydrofolate synthase [Bacteroidales bacterium]
MNYEETLAFIYSQLPMFQRIGAAAYKANLDNTYALMEVLGQPHQKFKSVHIAGTNGKGSTAHMLASIYQEAGFKTGLYTSPHLKDFRERIRLNGEMVSKEFVVDFVEKYSEKSNSISPSFFELTMAMAFKYFAEEEVDIVILETGMGGRLDSTNIVIPELSIITNIGKDHMQFLGDTLPKIAEEKAGIIKKDITVLIGEKQAEAQSVFDQKAREQLSPIFYSDDLIKLKKSDDDSYWFRIETKNNESIVDLNFPLHGSYQTKNLKTVVAAAILLKLPFDKIKKGIENVIKNTHFAGRWQILKQKPLTICDTAHNEDGLRYVVKQLEQTMHKTLHFILGVVNDKDIEHILMLLPKDAIYYFCKADIPRGLDVDILQEKAKKVGLTGVSYQSVNDALKAAQNNALKDDLVFVGGSTYTVAEVV